MSTKRIPNVEEGIQLIMGGASPIRVADAMVKPWIEWPEGSSPMEPNRINQRRETPGNSTPGADQTGPSDNQYGGTSRKEADFETRW